MRQLASPKAVWNDNEQTAFGEVSCLLFYLNGFPKNFDLFYALFLAVIRQQKINHSAIAFNAICLVICF